MQAGVEIAAVLRMSTDVSIASVFTNHVQLVPNTNATPGRTIQFMLAMLHKLAIHARTGGPPNANYCDMQRTCQTDKEYKSNATLFCG